MNVRWNRPASDAFHKAIRHIAEDSVTAAIAVQRRIDKRVLTLKDFPTKHPPDKMKGDNDGTYRAFTQDSLRVSYRIFKSSIHIIRVRHAKRKPLRY